MPKVIITFINTFNNAFFIRRVANTYYFNASDFAAKKIVARFAAVGCEVVQTSTMNNLPTYKVTLGGWFKRYSTKKDFENALWGK